MPASKAKAALTAERRTKLIRMRVAGIPFEDIAVELGYSSRGDASKDLIRALERNRDEEAAEVSVYRQQENERLDAELVRLDTLEAAARTVLTSKHIVVNNGRVIIHPDTNLPMEDDAPILQAIDRLVKIEEARRRNGERRAKLNGLDMPVKTEVSGPDGGAVPLGAGTLSELGTLIGISGETGPVDELLTDTGGEDTGDDSDQ